MNNKHLNIIGWILFVVSSLCFIASSIGNFWAMAGSIFFFVACLVFFANVFQKGRKLRKRKERKEWKDEKRPYKALIRGLL